MRLGIIDLGTNTFNLLIQGPRGKVYYNDKIPVKLGKGGIHKNEIAADAFARGLDALRRFKQICESKKVSQIFAFATSAVRSATNGLAFVTEVLNETGIKINVIDGHREAQFIYEGVKRAMAFSKTPVLIMDVGGGSTEFILAGAHGVLWQESYPLGVSRLLENVQPNDPFSEEDVAQLHQIFDDTLMQLTHQIQKHKPKVLIGSSGSFETLHTMCALKYGHPVFAERQTGGRMYLHEFEAIKNQLIRTNITERLVLPGMLAMRADTLHISAVEIDYVLKMSNIKEMQVSLYALKEGVLFSIHKNEEQWQTSLL